MFPLKPPSLIQIHPSHAVIHIHNSHTTILMAPPPFPQTPSELHIVVQSRRNKLYNESLDLERGRQWAVERLESLTRRCHRVEAFLADVDRRLGVAEEEEGRDRDVMASALRVVYERFREWDEQGGSWGGR